MEIEELCCSLQWRHNYLATLKGAQCLAAWVETTDLKDKWKFLDHFFHGVFKNPNLLLMLVLTAEPAPAALLCRMDGCALLATVLGFIQGASSTKDFSAADRTALFGE